MNFTLPDLPYGYEDLEPYIDAQTMEIHHTKHHKGYVDKLNNTLQQYPDLASWHLEETLQKLQVLPAYLSQPIRNNGGGHLNHSMFWTIMSPQGGGEPTGAFAEQLYTAFGSFQEFKDQFTQEALGRFGSGWAWLALGREKQLLITSTLNQDNPIMEGMTPILGVDVWEHAYYLTYQNRRAEYIEAWWNVVNWDQVARNYNEALERPDAVPGIHKRQ